MCSNSSMKNVPSSSSPFRGLLSGFMMYGFAGGVIMGNTRFSSESWTLSLSWNESRWSTFASILISSSYVFGRHGVVALSRVGPLLAAFGILSPVMLGEKAPFQTPKISLTVPHQNMQLISNSYAQMDKAMNKAVEVYRSNWKFANEHFKIEDSAKLMMMKEIAASFMIETALENGSTVDPQVLMTKEQVNNIEICEGDEMFGKMLVRALFNIMDLDGDGNITLEEAIVGSLILFDTVIDQAHLDQERIARLQDLSFRMLDKNNNNSLGFSDLRDWCAMIYEVNEHPKNDFHFNVCVDGKELSIEDVKKLGKLNIVLDMLTRDVLMAEYDVNSEGKITKEEFMKPSKLKSRFIFAEWLFKSAKASSKNGTYVISREKDEQGRRTGLIVLDLSDYCKL